VSIGVLGLLMVACYTLGWWSGRRAPDGVEAVAWRRLSRKLRRCREA
jgi:hypothetical protein